MFTDSSMDNESVSSDLGCDMLQNNHKLEISDVSSGNLLDVDTSSEEIRQKLSNQEMQPDNS